MSDLSAESLSAIREIMDKAKNITAYASSPKLSEADTRAVLIDPLLRALGYEDVSDITREYYVRNSQEFIDYVIRLQGRNILAIEAKSLSAELTDKAASQLVSYCSVDGIPWGVLTNGRSLKLYNAVMAGGIESKLMITIDLLAYNNEIEFNSIAAQLAMLSRTNMSEPRHIADWVTKRSMDRVIRSQLRNAESAVVNVLRRELRRAGVAVSRQDIAEWAQSALTDSVVRFARQPEQDYHSDAARLDRSIESASSKPLGRRMSAWVSAVEDGRVPTPAVLEATWEGKRVEAHVDKAGYVTCRGSVFANPTAAAMYVTGTSENGWKFWRCGNRLLEDLRSGGVTEPRPAEPVGVGRAEPSAEVKLYGYRNERWEALLATHKLSLPADLMARWEGATVWATVDRAGHVTCRGRVFANPTAAAAHIAGRTLSGWNFWTYQGRPLAEWEWELRSSDNVR